MGTSLSRNQKTYWDLFYDLCLYFRYLEVYQEHDQRAIRYINISLALTSSGSVAAWAVWHEIAWIWALIVAGSQVLNVSSAYMPYRLREKTLRVILPQMHKLLLDCEDDYDAVSSGSMTDHDIHSRVMALKRRLGELSDELYACGLPQCKRYQQEAAEWAKQYVATYVQ